MAKHRLLVALLPDADLARQIRTFRGAFTDPRRESIAPHLTLVSPMNVAEGDLADAKRLVRRVATEASAFELTLGPLATFAPDAPTLHLAVTDQSGATAEIRKRLWDGPFARCERRPFTPHVTLLRSASKAQIEAGLAVASLRSENYGLDRIGSGRDSPSADRGGLDFLIGGCWEVDRLFLMEQIAGERGFSWAVLGEEPFGGPTIVGRGGVELLLKAVTSLEPSATGLVVSSRLFASQGGSAGDTEPRVHVLSRMIRDGSDDDSLLVVTAEMAHEPGRLVGFAAGTASGNGASLEGLVTDEGFRLMGVARHVISHWCFQAALRGARIASTQQSEDAGVLEHLGFSRVGTLLVRQLR